MNNITVVLDNNNSGGRFWLKPEDVAKLLKVGWKLHGSRDARFRDEHDFGQYAENAGGMVDPRFCGALSYTVTAEDEDEAIVLAEQSFAENTPYTMDERGCDCCGPPFHMHEEW